MHTKEQLVVSIQLSVERYAMQRPIGYWVKQLDGAIEDAFAGVLSAERLTRRHWQVLSLVRETAPTREAVDAQLGVFDQRGCAANSALDELVERGWVERDADGRHRLGPAGAAAYDDLARKVGVLRRRTSEGVREEEYRTAVDVLRRMTENLTGPVPG
jgi:DNA-binding MarR family transcriptional regulator